MALFDDLQISLKKALKANDAFKVSILRLLISEIKNWEINNYRPADKHILSDEEVRGVLKKAVKTHKESIEMFEKGKRIDLADKEKKELLIIKEYLPEEVSSEEIRAVIKERLRQKETLDLNNIGILMGSVMPLFKGQADGKMVLQILKEEIKIITNANST